MTGLVQRLLRALGCNAPLFDDDRVEHRQHQAEQCHAGECPAPAQVLGQHPAQGHAQHRAEHAARHERPGQRRAHVAGEYRDHHGNADTAIGSLADPDQKARNEHLRVVFRQATAERGQAPQHGHQHQAAYPAETVGQQRQREGQQADHQRDDAAEQA
ncbi:hypothetical protein D3C79_729540 [compost metagenome]